MSIRRVLIVWGLLMLSVPVLSQQLSNIRKKKIIVSADTTQIDTASIVQIFGDQIGHTT
ncbi:MAG: hypothetical protein ACKOBX_07570 [Bacteroidota bacterium]